MAHRNQWYKIGLSPDEVKAIKSIHGEVWADPRMKNKAETIRLLVSAAIAHYDIIGPLMSNDAEYAQTEGFLLREWHVLDLIKNRFKFETMDGGRRN
jgi:hypothetical protein